jgi:hypothetical protein
MTTLLFISFFYLKKCKRNTPSCQKLTDSLIKAYMHVTFISSNSVFAHTILFTIKNNIMNKRYLLLLLTLVSFCVGALAQINYTRTKFTAPYSPISTSTGAQLVPYNFTNANSFDDQTVKIKLPIAINYNGTTYTTNDSIAIGINGFVYLTNSTVVNTSSATNTTLFNTTAPHNTIAPWYDDLDLDAGNDLSAEGEIIYQAVGEELIIQWTNIWASTSAAGLSSERQLNFQVRLYGSAHASKANQIEFCYGAINGTYNTKESASIGIENNTGGSGNYIDAITNSKVVSHSMMNTKMWPKHHFRFTPSTSAPTPLVSGSYTIGAAPSSDYNSISDAVADLNSRGIAGSVTFDLQDAIIDSSTTYFPIVIGPIVGTSATNTITITSTLTNGATLLSPGCDGSIGHESSATATSASSVICLVGSKYVTIKNLTLEGSYQNNNVDRGILVMNSSATNGASNNRIENITVRLNKSNTSSVGIAQETVTAPQTASGTNSNNKYLNVRVYNTYHGINLTNSTTAANNFADENNEIGNIGASGLTIVGDNSPFNIGGGTALSYGIRGFNQKGLKIHDCIVRNISNNGTTALDGILIDGTGTVHITCEVYNNNIQHITQQSTSTTAGIVTGIRLNLTSNSSSSKVYNNFISNLNSASAATTTRRIIGILAGGVSTVGSTYEHNIDFNTVIINPDAANCSNTCFQIGGPSVLTPTYNVRNNIFANYTGSQAGAFKHYCWVSSVNNSKGQGVSNRNILYIANPDNGFIGLGNTADYATLSNWKSFATNIDANSRSENPQLASLNDYIINPSINTPVESGGSFFGTLSWANTDIKGTTRNASTPDVGASEGNYTAFLDDDIRPQEFSSILPGEIIRVNTNFTPQAIFKNNGVNNQNASTVRYQIIGPASSTNIVYSQTATLPAIVSGASQTVSFPLTNITTPGIYSIRAISELTNDQSAANDTITAQIWVLDTLSGNINVGATQNYPFNTLTNAVKAINSVGIKNATTFLLTDAMYSSNETFPININTFSGLSNSNRFTIKPASNVNASIQGSSANFIIKINDADYVTIDGSNSVGGTTRNLSIINDSAIANSGAIWLSSISNGVQFNTIKNCEIKAGTNSITSTFGIYAAGTTISTTGTGANNHNLTIENNLVQRAYRGIYVRGTSSGINNDLVINNNEIGSLIPSDYVWLKGIDITYANGALIYRNKINNLLPTSSAAIGIELGAGVKQTRVYANTIDSIGTSSTSVTGAYGIAITGTTTNGVDSILIYNNFITSIASNNAGAGVLNVINGIRIAGGNKIYVDNNSVYLQGTYTGVGLSASCMVSTADATNIYVRNNVLINTLSNTNPTARSYAIYTALGVTLNEINNNAYYTAGTSSALSMISGVEYTNMNGLRQATMQDQNSLFYLPNFISNKNLHIPTGLSGIESAALPLTYITTDIDGDVRQATPDIGADEFNGTPQDVNPPGINYVPLSKTSKTTNRIISAIITDGSGINTTLAKPRVYFKKSTDDNAFISNSPFSNGWKFTEALNTTSPFEFEIDYALLNNGNGAVVNDTIQYFVVAEDLASTPNVGINGAEPNVPLTSADLSSSDFPITITNAYVIAPSVPDTVYIGQGHAYTSLTGVGGFFEAVNSSVLISNTVAFITSDLSETGAVELNEFSEDSTGVFTLTIKPDAPINRNITGSIGTNGLIRLRGTDRLIIDGRHNGAGRYLTFENTSKTQRSVVFYFKNDGSTTDPTIPGSEDVVIRNCNIIGGARDISSPSYTGSAGIIFANTIASVYYSGVAFGNKNISIIQNHFMKMELAIYANTHSNSILMSGMVIDSNEFGSKIDSMTIMARGIYLNRVPEIKVRYNLLHDFLQNTTSSTNSSGIYGIDIGNTSPHAEVSHNKIWNMRNTSQYCESMGCGDNGVYGISSSGDSTLIFNNTIHTLLTAGRNGTSQAVGIGGTGYYMRIYHNTVHLSGAPLVNANGGNSRSAIYFNSSGVRGTDIRNNIFSVYTTGTATDIEARGIYTIAGTNDQPFAVADYNVYNLVGNNPVYVIKSGKHTSLSAWQNVSGLELNSMVINPQFNSDSNLVLLPSTPIKGEGTPLSFITTDIIGDNRNNPPTPGAYEIPKDAESPVIVYDKLLNNVVASQRLANNFAHITDFATAVDINSGTKPRIYFKRTTDDNIYVDNTSLTTGWKYVEATNNTSPFSFNIDYTLLHNFSTLLTTDTIEYFVIAQDTADIPNVGINQAVLASSPTSVQLTAAHFPVTGNINSYSITSPLSGTMYVGLGGTYLTLTDNGGAFEAINNAALSGDLDIILISNTQETGIHELKRVAETGLGNYTVKITTTGPATVEGTINNNPLLKFNGVERLIIDGGMYFGTPQLNFTNKGNGSVIAFTNECKFDTIMNIAINGSSKGDNNGLLTITNNTDSIYIFNNHFNHADSIPTNAIYAGGTIETNDGIVIDSNRISNFFTNGIFVNNAGNGSNWVITGNDFYSTLAIDTTSKTCINFIAGANSNNNLITRNRIGGSAANMAGSPWTKTGNSSIVIFKGISYLAGNNTTTSSITENQIRNISLRGSTIIYFTGIEQLSGSGNLIIDANSIGDSLNTDSIVIYTSAGAVANCGIWSSSTNTRTISNNNIMGISSMGTGNNNVVGINYLGNGQTTVEKNTIHNLFSAGNERSETAARSTVGIYCGSDSKNNIIRKNHITKLINTAGAIPIGSAATIVRGIYVNSSTSGGKISQNYIAGVENLSTGTGEIHGIYFFTGASNARWLIDNNVIYLTNGTNTNNVRIEGIHDRNAESNRPIDIVNNTVYIGGTSAAGNVGSACYQRLVASSVTLQNNIFYNERTGGTGNHAAVVNAINPPNTNWTANTSNYNLFVTVDTTNMFEWGNTNATIGPIQYKKETGADQFAYFTDHLTINSTLLFNNVYTGDLSINTFNPESWAVNGKGKSIDTLNYSFDDSVRTSSSGIPIDIGAYEFSTLTAPLGEYHYTSDTITELYFLNRKLATLYHHNINNQPDYVYVQYHSGVQPNTSVTGDKIYSYQNITPFGGSNYLFDVKYEYSPAEIGSIPAANLKFVQSNDNGTTFQPALSSVANTSAHHVTANNISTFGIYTLTSSTHPLPVKLTSFTAQKQHKNVNVNWVTSSEINSAYFIVEASYDGKNFKAIGKVAASGNSTTTKSYELIHEQAQNGLTTQHIIFYRLLSYDINGAFETSSLVSVRFDDASLNNVVAYPNPFTSNLNITIPSNIPQQVTIELFDIQGAKVQTSTWNIEAQSNNLISLDELNTLNAGVYFVKVHLFNEVKTIKLIKQ